MPEEIHGIYQSLCADSRFDALGASLRRQVVEGALVYEIALSAFEFDADTRTAVDEFANQHGLKVVDGSDGSLVLRPRPGS